jgi:hypothetical protein
LSVIHPWVVIDQFDVAVQVTWLLGELCVDLGLCLPTVDQQRLAQDPPRQPDAFTDAVFAAEGMDPALDRALYRQVQDRVEQRMATWPGAHPEPSMAHRDSTPIRAVRPRRRPR